MDPLIIKKHIEYDEEFVIERDEEGFLIEPSCPSCGLKVGRPKCAWEYSDCPRHDLNNEWRKAMREDPTNHRFHKNGYCPEECYFCKQSESAHVKEE